MKKLLTALAVIAFVSFCSAASAETVLSDNDLGELYASDIAVAAQKNIAVLVAGGSISNVDSGIEQKNYAKVKRDVDELWFGDEAIAVVSQTNVAALKADNNISNVEIEQKNKAKISRRVDILAYGSAGPAVAVGPQANYACLRAGDETEGGGSISSVDIKQKNKAKVKGDVQSVVMFGAATAVESQTNIAGLCAEGNMSNVDIEQKNKAKVYRHADVIAHNATAIGNQTNVSFLCAEGNISGVSISQRNSAYVGSGATL